MAKIPEILRRRAGAVVVDNFFNAAARLGRLHPLARPERHRVELIRDVPYLASGRREHLLDVYRPLDRAERLPVVLYVHGGGFRILSKDTHWIMGLAFARRGYLVFNISYRLAPRHPFPAAIADTCAAALWVARNAERYGGDPGRIVFAGESAGANLVTALAVATVWRRREPFAREVFDAGVMARAVVPACGLLQVSDPERFRRWRPDLPARVYDRIVEVSEAYLGRFTPLCPEDLDLADPLCALERGEPPERPLPAFFAGVGTWDPLLPDTRRLKAAIDRLGGHCEARYFPRELHAFHALPFRRAAREYWRGLYAWLDERLGVAAEADGVESDAVRSAG